ncbi:MULTISPECIES: 1-(5-phosphoribosyl)-5-[(5-phosphoribosylamino)methylideneamino]imidazole-4-carboxamide isomerase [Aeribacillus]|jgi:phosphoribosylformimino-5-aminoimidazole carboxamide ribotide isomerase|uniref:1-(5-phosphoribosyl)-5-[(5-phosphoribosylamino)methylideneamino] imidazole-4-carboxamide isomerase n=1 Tax=Aeribacillus pallidus TaxID=33936 RepID=A0A163ZM48_9BACI|nr:MULTISPECIES: 1-(5-phosphoribosyl)-5-[(5-phosphoribosylamino)methylideneamino]imidazole-4-carboxamide isomerase [Aeribacillus]ASS90276.1 1-(5-phosphoribosyl)-5-[(5-phosphoribosylamino)methylideneamino]imidazole-4-carboxamide isomerase [Aeribacillus pallidus]KZM55172.1 1-(5-phosphoribosyl)-5-[(5-phosphoribosylamino)methylideneamino]imidazole-4-carboxamide isomerase [Aeribacillus pallidus]MDR9793973.1 1-(5-phosphoribosyl)-5-[(5-phosphoribosylamino)methylideneamino]imidazole-4-carboxamide isomer
MMSFTIFPAIDLRGGKCVRLLQGDYNKETVYGDSPFAVAESFVKEGADWIHMVDLDGAKEGVRVNHQHVLKVAKELKVKVQVGGGIRTEKDVYEYLENGISRVILGSSAVSNRSFVEKMLAEYGGRIAIGIDAKNGYVSTEGWLNTSEVKAVDLGKELAKSGAETFIFTDIATDGMLSGPNVKAIVEMAKATGKTVIASGGVSSIDDLKKLKQYEQDGVKGAIVGKALYTKKFSLRDAIHEVNGL